ncbi:MAG TPA: tail fiber protein [Bryobacteraceae bacterium]|nr:tail fiber protein [Bryobacteraceae bacterium]
MSDQYVSEIRLFSFSFAPKGWAQCNGQLLSISQNAALFALLGTMYGGNGQSTFGLPDLRGRVPLHFGSLQGGGTYLQGQTGGAASVTITTQTMPSHNHLVNANSNGNANAGSNTAVPGGGVSGYGASPDTAMNPAMVGNAGSNQPHGNTQPYLVLNFCISLTGIFPSRN